MALELLIKDDLKLYEQMEIRLEEMLRKERENLQRYAESENPKPAYLARMNFIFSTMAAYIEASEALISGIMMCRHLVSSTEEDLRRRLKAAKEENEIMHLYLRDLGHNPDLCRYMKFRDFQ